MVSSNTETKILALDFVNREKHVAMVLTPLCDHRVDARCREDIAAKLLRAQNATDKTYNEKGYVKGKKEFPSTGNNTDPRSKTTHISFKLKDGGFANYENKGACRENGPCPCSNLEKGLSCYKNRRTCDCPQHGHRFQSKNSVGDLQKHRGPYRNPKQHDAPGGSGAGFNFSCVLSCIRF